MSLRPTGKVVQPKPYQERQLVCDQCGEVIRAENARKPHFVVEWRAEVGYDDEGYNSWQADLCSLACVQDYAAAGAPKIARDW